MKPIVLYFSATGGTEHIAKLPIGFTDSFGSG